MKITEEMVKAMRNALDGIAQLSASEARAALEAAAQADTPASTVWEPFGYVRPNSLERYRSGEDGNILVSAEIDGSYTTPMIVAEFMTAPASPPATSQSEGVVWMHRTSHKISDLMGWSEWSGWQYGFGKSDNPSGEIKIENHQIFPPTGADWFGIEIAARWHDQRAINTPDAFEMELHEKSAAAIRALASSSVAAKEAVEVKADERDIYEVSNQLGGYVDPSTEPNLARFLIREAEEACKLADEIVRLRAALSRTTEEEG